MNTSLAITSLTINYISTMVNLCYTRIHNILKVVCASCKQRLFSSGSERLQHVQEDIHNPTSKGLNKFTVAIEGNIGCGKSTLMNYFKNNPACQTMQEPVSQWTNVDGHNALKFLYEDPQRWSFMFNNYAMLSRLQMYSSVYEAPVKMIERSLHSTKYIFVQNSYAQGAMTGLEYSVLGTWFDYLLSQPITQIDLIVYLQTSPEICYERMCQRGREEESSVPLSFVKHLHKLHEDWLIHKQYPVPAPVLVLDANSDLEATLEMYKENSSKIMCGCV